MLHSMLSDFDITQQSYGVLSQNAKAFVVDTVRPAIPVNNQVAITRRNFSITCRFAAHQLGTIVDEAKIRLAFQRYGDVTDVRLAKIGFNSVSILVIILNHCFYFIF